MVALMRSPGDTGNELVEIWTGDGADGDDLPRGGSETSANWLQISRGRRVRQTRALGEPEVDQRDSSRQHQSALDKQ
jgi:hypothetical protein